MGSVFSELESLSSLLNLNSNRQLAHIDSVAFADLGSLASLPITPNPLSISISTGVFARLVSLKHLDLSGNPVLTLDSINVPHLLSLDLLSSGHTLNSSTFNQLGNLQNFNWSQGPCSTYVSLKENMHKVASEPS